MRQEGLEPYKPILTRANGIRRLVGVQPQVLFQETEVMLDGETPKVYQAQ